MKTVEARGADLRTIAFNVLCGHTTVLKNAVAPDLILAARKAIFDWAKSTDPAFVHPKTAGGLSHVVSYLPAKSSARYISHDYNFFTGDESTLPPDHQLFNVVMPVFEALREIYVTLLNVDYQFGKTYDGWTFQPQVIQYPRGGGFFQEHTHAIDPQRIGLVLSGSYYGRDFHVGGGRFRDSDGKWETTEGIHDTGDVTLFRYDIGHDISPIDPDQPLDWSREDGRWSFVLPLKPVHA